MSYLHEVLTNDGNFFKSQIHFLSELVGEEVFRKNNDANTKWKKEVLNEKWAKKRASNENSHTFVISEINFFISLLEDEQKLKIEMLNNFHNKKHHGFVAKLLFHMKKVSK